MKTAKKQKASQQRGESYRAIPEYYDAEYAGYAWLQKDVPFFLAQAEARQEILEVASGSGRCAAPMAMAGHRVVGVDYDPAMVERARQRAASAGLDEAHCRFEVGDALALKAKGKFDWVCIFFNTFLVFTTLEQQDAVLAAMVRHLKPGGRIWIDIFQPNLALLAQDRTTGLDPIAFYVPELGRTIFKTTDVRRDPARQTQRVGFNYLWFDERGRARRQRRQFTMTFIFPRELEMLVQRHGLVLANVYGDYDGSALGPDSPRIIAECRRGRALG